MESRFKWQLMGLEAGRKPKNPQKNFKLAIFNQNREPKIYSAWGFSPTDFHLSHPSERVQRLIGKEVFFHFTGSLARIHFNYKPNLLAGKWAEYLKSCAWWARWSCKIFDQVFGIFFLSLLFSRFCKWKLCENMDGGVKFWGQQVTSFARIHSVEA